ncbi:uncharacterized protein TM35_000015970 [Trypanosoma theileri]|uniref:Uncharacterized protein n=1 Tax=Trypanosoma theileri TaxID=67003 RepID=A0A1X0PB90_9TRYP|nr:uncharacterized protein TM35_000015970 [Trypanosoma theileri]ORC93720.1 hypothetical protein TM35_000015970 [Trypanosoma theileri]
MWGGVKARGHHGDVFRAWGGSQPLEPLRRRLYREPRPWHLAWALHRHRHLLADRHCARLLAWCATVVQLEQRRIPRRQAYMYTQQAFQVMAHSHKVGAETYQEFFRLCAVGRDLTTAFRWQQYLVETGELSPLSHYTWLLHIASLSPSDESAEDMAEAVWETYLARYCSQVKHDITGETKFAHYQPSNDDEAKQLEKLFKAFKVLRPKIVNGAKPELMEFIDALPESENLDVCCSAWPTVSRHHTFPHLEAGVPWTSPTISHPHLRDSILHESFVSDLKSAAFSNNVKRVVSLIQEYRERVAEEKEKASARKYLAGERDIWRDFSDPSSLAFRTSLVEDGGVTSELYHYLIVSMSVSQPSVALRTLRRMQEANLRVLDVTRAVMIVRCEGSPKEQLQMFQEQLQEIRERQKIEEDYDVTREVELYWKFCYTDFFYYRNALNRRDFYRMLMEGLGPRRVQQFILDAQVYGTCSFEDITVLDEAFRNTAAMYYRNFIGNEVNKALDEITKHIPKLDISLIGSIQHFSDYALSSGDFIATDISTLRTKLVGFSTICVLDSSFVETSEYFLTVGKTINASNNNSNSGGGSSLVLIPYCCLQQLATTIEESKDYISFDPALQEANKSEPFIASQRLRSLFALLGNKEKDVKTRILHFTESLLSHAIPETTLKTINLDPAKSDNDHLLLVVAMIRAIADKDTNVVLCTDDPSLVKQLQSSKLTSLFSGKISVMSSEPPKNIVQKEENLINDNPDMCILTEFQPRLQFSNAISTHVPSNISLKPSPIETLTEDTEVLGSAWLDMLNEEEEEKEETLHSSPTEGNTSTTNTTTSSSTNLTYNQNRVKHEKNLVQTVTNKDEEKIAQEYEKLMNLYDSEHAVAPVGVLMAKASSLGSVFDQFDTIGPDTEMDQAMSAPAPQREIGQDKEKPRRRSPLEREDLRNRGASNKERFRLARRLGNISGGRVPFNLRYRILEVDITDERGKHYKEAYKEGLEKKRASFKRKFQRSYLVGSAPE